MSMSKSKIGEMSPAIATPAIATPANATPAIATPAIATPAITSIEAAESTIKDGVAKVTAGFEAAQTQLQEGVAKATAGFEATQTKMKIGVEKAMKTTEELVAFSQGNVEAIVKSGQIWVAGVQDLSKHMAAAAKASMEESMAAFKALTSMKSLKDAFELQSSFTRSAMEKSLAESGKLTDASMKLTEQALAPIAARVTVAVEKFAKAA